MSYSNDLKFNKEFLYALIIVFTLLIGLFFVNKYFDIQASTFTIKEAKKPSSETPNSFEEKLQESLNEATEKVKNSVSP